MTNTKKLRLAIERKKKAVEGAIAMREYKADQAAFLAKGERLRAERLAKKAKRTKPQSGAQPNEKNQT
ncbi:hypothetical protein ACFPL7_02085 [Dongia soli]|uniref:DUF4169 family protein n=1 Tax=Dongia soli TaxID=600628 RepID=A0ABU5EFU5_9PROT|nr:hypothetical protein [Dongia soli]MDY0885284.1 hypothetical protein [Dongia soli]